MHLKSQGSLFRLTPPPCGHLLGFGRPDWRCFQKSMCSGSQSHGVMTVPGHGISLPTEWSSCAWADNVSLPGFSGAHIWIQKALNLVYLPPLFGSKWKRTFFEIPIRYKTSTGWQPAELWIGRLHPSPRYQVTLGKSCDPVNPSLHTFKADTAN